jgi:hypothetical protein
MALVLPVFGKVLLNNLNICQYYLWIYYLKLRRNMRFVQFRQIYMIAPFHNRTIQISVPLSCRI